MLVDARNTVRARGRQLQACGATATVLSALDASLFNDDGDCDTAAGCATDVGEPVGNEGFDIPQDIVRNIDSYRTRHSGSLPKQQRYALITLCLLAKVGVDVSSTPTKGDTLQERFDSVRKRLTITDLLSQPEAQRAIHQMSKDMKFAAKSVDQRRSAAVKSTEKIDQITAISMVHWKKCAARHKALSRHTETAASIARGDV